ncbi:MAG: translocation/assembly module TamB domain-containing protein [Thermoanaerobaculia bacterium]|nr:translocation/assembly module TamB domain-containing protein [Thermoanaerobaculia bacterium]
MTPKAPGSEAVVRPRRRPGRWRRWVVRPVVWIMVLVLVLLALLLFAAHRPSVQRLALDRLLPRIESLLGRVLTVDEVEAHLLPLTVELRGVTLAGPRIGDPPVATVDRLFVDIDLPRLWHRRLKLDDIEVTGLTLFVEQLGSETNLPSVRRGDSSQKSRMDFSLGTLRIVDSRARYNNLDVPLVVSANGISASLLGQKGLAGQGTLAVDAVDLELNDHQISMSLDGRVLVDSDGLAFDSMRLQGEDSTLLTHGSLVWKGDPTLSIAAEGTVSTVLAKRLGYLGDEVVGRGELNGSFDWRPEAWGFRAEVSSPSITLLGTNEVTLVEARVAGDPNGVLVDLLEGHFADGDVRGKYTATTGEVEPSNTLDLVVWNTALGEVLRRSGIDVQGVTGRLSGEVSYRFDGVAWQSGTGWGNVDIAGGQSAALRLPIVGSIPFSVDRGRLSAQAARLRAPQQTVVASATYDLASAIGAIDFSLSSTDLGPLSRVIPGGDATPPPTWLPTRGSGRISGIMSLSPGGVSTSLDLFLDNPVAPGLATDRLNGHLDLESTGIDNLRLEFTGPDGAGLVSGRVPFSDTLDGLGLAVELQDWPLTAVRPWLPFELPLDGSFSGGISLIGLGTAVTGTVEGTLAGAQFSGTDIGTLRTTFDWDAERVVVHRLEASVPGGRLDAQGSYGIAKGALDFVVDGEDFDLSAMVAGDPMEGGADRGLAGTVTARASIGGTMDRPRVEVEASAKGLAVGETRLGDAGTAWIDAAWEDGGVTVKGAAPGWLELDGSGRLDDQGSDITVQIELLDLGAPALVLGRPEGEFSGAISGTARLEGRGRFAVDRATLSIPTAEIRAQDRQLKLLEPAKITWQGSLIDIESIYFGEEGTDGDVFVTGTLGIGDPSVLNLRLQASAKADWIEVFVPTLDLAGDIDVLGSVRGTFEQPLIRAQAGLTEGRIRASSLGLTLNEVEAVILLDPDAIVVDHVAGTLGGGNILVGGRLAWPSADQPLEGRLQATFEDATLFYPEGMELRGDGEIVWSATSSGQQLLGQVVLDRARYRKDVDIDLLSLVELFFRRQPEQVTTADDLLTNIGLNIAIRAPGSLRMKNNIADLRGSADLSLRGTLARPVVFGVVESEAGSTLVYSGNEYQLERAVISLTNPYRIEPLIDVEAVTEVASYDISVALFGNLDRLNVTLTSDPPLPDAEVLSLLVGGRPFDGEVGSKDAEVSAESLLYGQATSLLGKRVGDLFGFDSLRLEPLSTSGKSLSSARVSVGKRLSSRLYATYSYDPSSTANQRIQLEWQVSDRLLVRLVQDDDSYAVDLLWENSF